MKKAFYCFAAFLLLGYMVSDPLDAVHASKNGLLLWFNTIIPTLLPFIILSNFILALDGMKYITFWIAPLFHRWFRISRDGSYAVIAGFLCGYPMGAKITADLVRSGKISRKEGTYLLTFCNNVSPMFIISYIVASTLQSPELAARSLLIMYLSPVLCALLLQIPYRKKAAFPDKEKQPYSREVDSPSEINFKLIDRCIMDGFETVVKLGGYIILFSIITQLVREIPVTNLFSCIVLGNIEITNGMQVLAGASYAPPLTYILVMSSASFGGLSSIAQTESMLKDSGLSIGHYIPAKLLNAGIAGILAMTSIWFLPV